MNIVMSSHIEVQTWDGQSSSEFLTRNSDFLMTFYDVASWESPTSELLWETVHLNPVLCIPSP